MDKEFVDLGLPSGRLWCAENEIGYYTYNQAVEKFGDSLPTKADFEELIDHTYHEWDSYYEWNRKRQGMVFYSLNSDKSVFFPANGYRDGSNVDGAGFLGDYWSSTPYDKYEAYDLYFFSKNYVRMFAGSRDYGCSVRLVREPNKHCNK